LERRALAVTWSGPRVKQRGILLPERIEDDSGCVLGPTALLLGQSRQYGLTRGDTALRERKAAAGSHEPEVSAIRRKRADAVPIRCAAEHKLAVSHSAIDRSLAGLGGPSSADAQTFQPIP
jgi:hypothetical protein